MRRCTACLLVIIAALWASCQINIWEGMGRKVKMTPYIAPGCGNIAVIVCPGGSYFWHDSVTEGEEVARWLQAAGISAFVLDYRTAKVPAFILHHRYVFRGNRYPDPQDDLRQAMRVLRNNADQYGIDPHRVGAMGFSAGGHLVMSVAELLPKAERPDFVVSVYPVVTMIEDCVHRRSRRGLLGDDKQHDAALCELLSLERHVPADCPPVFLVNCIDDPVVDYRNSVLLDSALRAQSVRHVYMQFATGGHGFGASESKGSPECRAWKESFLQWLTDIGL